MTACGVTTTLYLVRHAAHDRLDRILCGRMPGVSLGKAGRADAGRLATRLLRENVASVQSSPLERARETAEPIAEGLGLAVEVSPALVEIDFGAWTGRPFKDLDRDPRWTTWNTARSVARPPGGETMLEVQARMVGHVETTRAAHPDAAIVLVSHGDVIKAALAYYLGLSIDSWMRFEVSPASVSTLVVGDWGAKVLRLNEAAA